MPGSIYNRSLRDARAFSEGVAGQPATNPHPAGSSANAAYAAGAAQATAGNCQTYAGVAECSRSGEAPSLFGQPEPQAASVSFPAADWTKQQLADWLIAQGAQESESYLMGLTKSELLTKAGVN